MSKEVLRTLREKFESQRAFGLRVGFCFAKGIGVRFFFLGKKVKHSERSALIVIYKQCVRPGQVMI